MLLYPVCYVLLYPFLCVWFQKINVDKFCPSRMKLKFRFLYHTKNVGSTTRLKHYIITMVGIYQNFQLFGDIQFFFINMILIYSGIFDA